MPGNGAPAVDGSAASSRQWVVGLLVVVVAATVVTTAGAATAPAGSADHDGDGVAVTLTLTNASATVDETSRVELRAHGAGVAGYEANVSYDPEAVTVAAVEGGALGDPQTNTSDEAGWTEIAAASASEVENDSVLATLVVRPEAAGEHELGLTQAYANDGTAESLETATANATLSIGAADSGGGLSPSSSDETSDDTDGGADDGSGSDDETEGDEADGGAGAASGADPDPDDEGDERPSDSEETAGDDPKQAEEADELPALGPAPAIGVVLATVLGLASRRTDGAA